MTDPKDSQLDALLSKHLSSELDAQLGRANARFDQMRRMQRQFTDAPAQPRRLQVNRFTLGVIGAALAAAIAVVMIFAPTKRITPGPVSAPIEIARNDASIVGDPAPAMFADETIPVQRDVSWQTLDRGTVFVGEEEQPMRRLVRQRVDNYRWTDPEHKFNVQMSVPRDEVMLVGMKSY